MKNNVNFSGESKVKLKLKWKKMFFSFMIRGPNLGLIIMKIRHLISSQRIKSFRRLYLYSNLKVFRMHFNARKLNILTAVDKILMRME